MYWRTNECVTDLRTCRLQGTYVNLQRRSGGCMPPGAPPGSNAGVQGHHRAVWVEKGDVQRVLHSSHVYGTARSQQEALTGLQRRPAEQAPESLPPPFRDTDTVTEDRPIRAVNDAYVFHIVAKNFII